VPPNYEDALRAIQPQDVQTEASLSRELESELVEWDADENVDAGNHEENDEEHDNDDDECKVGD
jgi:hypothetical protein